MKEDWIECNLEEVCEVLDNLRKPINSHERTERIKGKPLSELFPYYGATGQVGYIDDYITDGDYVLLGEDGAPFLDYKKNVAYKITGKTWVNNHAHILKSRFNDDFLLHYLNQFQYKEYVTGTTRLKLTQGALKRIPIPLAPLPIQRAIVLKIESLFVSLDKGIGDLKIAREQLKIYRQAVLKKAFEGRFTHKNLKSGELPEGWKWVKLRHVTDNVQKVKRKEKNDNEEFLYVDISGIDNSLNKIVSHKVYLWKDSPSRAQQIIKTGDILFSTVRTYLKNIAFVNNAIYENQICSSGFSVIRPNKEKTIPKYLILLLNFRGIYKTVKRIAKRFFLSRDKK